jgi:cbb3-type cytochrome oxidase subunit 3
LRDLNDLIPLAWFGLIVIGVISSVVKSAKKQAAARASQGEIPAVRVTGVPQGLHAQFAANAAQVAQPPPVAVPLPVRRPLPASRPAAAPPAPAPAAAPQTVPDYIPPLTSYTPAPLDSTPPPHALGVQPRPVRAARLFGSSHAVLRSIVAAEVLGKPRALRDEY